MACPSSSLDRYVENVVPHLLQETYMVRLELEKQLTILKNFTGCQKTVSENLCEIAFLIPHIKELAADVSVYHPDDPHFVSYPDDFFLKTFPNICDSMENTLHELSFALSEYPDSQGWVASQISTMLDILIHL